MNCRILFLFFIAILFSGAGFAEDTNWGYRYTGPDYWNTISDIIPMTGGGSAFVAGGTLIRVDDAGAILWQRQIGELLSQAAETSGGGILTATLAPDSTVYRFDAGGRALWQKKYGLAGTQRLFQILRVPNGFVLAFQETDAIVPSRRNLLLYEINPAGDLTWARRYTGFNPASILRTQDGGFLVLGRPNISILKLNARGVAQWERRLGQGGEFPAQIVAAAGSYLVLSGHPVHDGGEVRLGIALRSMNPDGVLLWQRGYKAKKELNPFTITVLPDGILIGGFRENEQSYRDAFLLDTDAQGALRRFATFGNQHHQTLTHLFARKGQVMAVIWDLPASVPGPKERNWILKFPADQIKPTSCNRILAPNPPVVEFDLPVSPSRPIQAIFQNVHPLVETIENRASEAEFLRTSLCSE